MFDLSLFGNHAFCGVSLATFAVGAGMFAMFPYLTFYLQNALGYSPLQGGLRLLPATVLTFIVPLLTRNLGARAAPGALLGGGLGLTSLGLFLMHGITPSSQWTTLLPGLLLAGAGVGLANPAIANIALGVVPSERSGMASGISNTFRIGGLAVGVAALGAIFQHRVATSLHASLGGDQGELARAVSSGGTHTVAALAHGRSDIVEASLAAFVNGMNDDPLDRRRPGADRGGERDLARAPARLLPPAGSSFGGLGDLGAAEPDPPACSELDEAS